MSKPPLESQIEQAHRKIAIAAGWFVAKIVQAIPNGFPDRFYASARHRCPYCNKGRVVIMEWKRPGGRTSPQQKLRIEQLRYAGVEVYIVDSLAEANRRLGIGGEAKEEL